MGRPAGYERFAEHVLHRLYPHVAKDPLSGIGPGEILDLSMAEIGAVRRADAG